MRKKSLSLEKEYCAWAGSRQSLLALCSLMEDQFQGERGKIRREYDQRVQRRDREEAELSNTGETPDGRLEMLRDARRLAEEARDQELNFLRTRLAITDEENDETRDYATELIDEHDFHLTRRISISCSSWGTGRTCSISISNKPYGNVRLTVSGDSPWVRAAFGALEKELRKGRPWWSVVRHDVAFPVIGVGLAVSATLAVAGIVSIIPLIDVSGDLRFFSVAPLLFVLLFATFPATNWLVTRLFPSFEVRDPDAVTGGKKFSVPRVLL